MLQNAGVLWILTSQMCFAPQRRAIFCHFFRIEDFQNGSEHEVFCTFLLTNVLRATAACHFSRSRLANRSDHEVFCTFWLTNVLRATAACHFSDRDLQNGSEAEVFCTFWRTNVLRATAACEFSPIATSKMAPGMWCFVHFDLQMCFAPQRRAMFPISSQQLPPHPPL